MRKKIIFVIPVFLILIFYGASAYYTGEYQAIFMERTVLEKSVFYLEQAEELKNPGKIYYKDDYIFVNERYKGVHIIDNSDPKNPVNKGFIVVPGCLDIAVKDNVMYLDNSVDLVAFDLTTKQVLKRLTNVFPEPISPTGYSYREDRPNNYVLVEWKKR